MRQCASGLAVRVTPSYLGTMRFWRNVSPSGAISDFAQVWRENPTRWRVLAVSAAMTFSILWVFLPEDQRAEPRPPEVIYISTFDEARTEAEIVASNIANQERQDELAALEAEREELRKELYRELGRATFIDVEEMEREIAREEAAAEPGAQTSLRSSVPVAE